MEQFDLSDIQAQEILNMRLQRLTGLEREKIIQDYQDILKEIERLKGILASPALVDQVVREEIQELMNEFSEPRRTEIIPDAGDICMEDLIPNEEMVVTISRAGYIKRTPLSVYRNQNRGGKGRTGMSTREEDIVTSLRNAADLKEFVEDGSKRLLITLDDPDNETPRVVADIVAKGGQILSVRTLRPSLEDAYLKLIREGEK
jgi:DNA gyrase/topoisomerase IV subunit A